MGSKSTRKTWIYVVALRPERGGHRKVRDRNPRGHKGRPCVYVGMSGKDPGKAFAGSDFSEAPREVQRHGRRLLSRHTQYRYSRLKAVEAKYRLIKDLRDKHYWVFNDSEAKTHSVYVILLSREIQDDPKVTKLNPDAKRAKPCVYVGQTGKTPKERLKQHKRGELANRWVRDHGVRLMPRLYEHLNPLNELQSLRMERRLARRLRKLGYTVLGGT